MIKNRARGISSKLPVRKSVEVPPRQVVRVGRNAPCPCGSGKKYKTCHAAEGEVFLQKLARQREKENLLARQREEGAPWYKRILTKALH
jgi:hypothetical protein